MFDIEVDLQWTLFVIFPGKKDCFTTFAGTNFKYYKLESTYL